MKNEYEQKVLSSIDLTQDRPFSDIVYTSLRDAIINGTFPPGKRINEKYISIRLNISRTPVRQAVSRLREEGLVESVLNYGVIVSNTSLRSIKEIFRIRKSLEVILFEAFIECMSESDITQLEKLCAKMYEAEENAEIDEVFKAFSEYNSYVMKVANMPRLNILIEQISDYLKNFRNYSFFNKERRLRAIEEHTKIIDLIKARDTNALAEAVEQHITHSEQETINRFEDKNRIYNSVL